jgi:predicted nucleic acid-binding protein
VIFDTNVLIYLSKKTLNIIDLIPPRAEGSISIISYIEALGFGFETERDEHYMKLICSSFRIVELSDPVITATINIRKRHKIKLPDAIIYATALIEGLPLLTNNTDDFKKLGNRVKLIDPFNL